MRMDVAGLVIQGCAYACERHWSRQDSDRSDIFGISFGRLAVSSFSYSSVLLSVTAAAISS